MSTLLVLGNAAIDLTFRMGRLPAAGETMLASVALEDVGGKGLNQAVAAHRAGARVRLVAGIGQDRDSSMIRRSLSKEGLSTADLIGVGAPTDRSIVMLSEEAQNMIVTCGSAAQKMGPDIVTSACAGLGAGDILLVQGNLPRDTTLAALQQARRRGMHTIANPAPMSFDWTDLIPMLDLVIVNEVEAAQVDVRTAPCAVTTRGSEGAELQAGSTSLTIKAPSVRAVDSTGAGDVLIGVLAAGLWRGMEMEPALRWGVAAASAKVQRLGSISAFPDAAELANLRP